MERNSVYCLLCKKPQKAISTHLKRVCMKTNTKEEREQEAARAVASQNVFAREGRVWDFSELEEFCKDEASCVALCLRLQTRGFIVTNTPQICPIVPPTQRSQKKDVLTIAKDDMDYIQKKMLSGDSIPHTAATAFRQYCEAILLLEHQLTGKDVMEFCVQDWIDRKEVEDVGVWIQLSSTARHQGITLTEQEAGCFECYFKSIRPISLVKQSGDKTDKGKFFLGEGGGPLTNPASDLQRLKSRYLPSESEDAVAASDLTSDLLTGQSTPGQASASLPTSSTSMQDWDAYCRAFPVTLSGDPPSKDMSLNAGFPNYRPYYHKWRDIQLRQRVQYILSHSTDRKGNPPKAARIQMSLDKETAWTTNTPTVDDVLKAWVPPKQKVEDNEFLIRSITEQNWKGLALKDFGPKKGKGVIALMPFSKGDPICDYHGTVISEAEGKQRLQSGYLFFFKGEGGRGFCIDATASPCTCHPHMETYGRMMNHSRKNPNVKPQMYNMNTPNGPQITILLTAQRDIRVGEELLFDYGVTKGDFGGEGQDLEWLDN